MDIYVAAAEGMAKEAAEVIETVNREGHRVTHNWPTEVLEFQEGQKDAWRSRHIVDNMDRAAWGRSILRTDLRAILEADLVIVLDQEKTTTGRILEMGYAMAHHKPILLIRLKDYAPRPHPFYYHPLIRRAADMEEGLSAINALQGLMEHAPEVFSPRAGRMAVQPRSLEAWAAGEPAVCLASHRIPSSNPSFDPSWEYDSEMQVWFPTPAEIQTRYSEAITSEQV